MSAKELPPFWFGPPPELLPGEEWVAHWAANRAEGSVARGGGLHLTTRRVVFSPHRVDKLIGASSFSCSLDDIASVGVAEAQFALKELFSGGLRSRVRIDLTDGRTELFVVSEPEVVAESLRAKLRERG